MFLPSCCCLLICSQQVNSCLIYVNSPLKTSFAEQSLQSPGETRLEERTELGHPSKAESRGAEPDPPDAARAIAGAFALTVLAAASPQSQTLPQEQQQPACFACRLGKLIVSFMLHFLVLFGLKKSMKNKAWSLLPQLPCCESMLADVRCKFSVSVPQQPS